MVHLYRSTAPLCPLVQPLKKYSSGRVAVRAPGLGLHECTSGLNVRALVPGATDVFTGAILKTLYSAAEGRASTDGGEEASIDDARNT